MGHMTYVVIKSLNIALLETNSSPPKMDGWKMNFLFGFRPIFRGELLVSVDSLPHHRPTLRGAIHAWPRRGLGNKLVGRSWRPPPRNLGPVGVCRPIFYRFTSLNKQHYTF